MPQFTVTFSPSATGLQGRLVGTFYASQAQHACSQAVNTLAAQGWGYFLPTELVVTLTPLTPRQMVAQATKTRLAAQAHQAAHAAEEAYHKARRVYARRAEC